MHRIVAWCLAPFWMPFVPLWLRLGRGYRIADHARVRAEFARIRRETEGPLLVCANHLTMIDSFLIGWALASSGRYLIDFDAMQWNTPERRNFASGAWMAALAWLAKCIPITRGGERAEVAGVLRRVQYLLSRGELALIFPEGGRSRTGRVDPDAAAWGVGRVVAALPGCRVLCVYMRGDEQEGWGSAPPSGDTLRLRMEVIEPACETRGLRRTRELAQQITAQLARMERAYFDQRAQHGGDEPHFAGRAFARETSTS